MLVRMLRELKHRLFLVGKDAKAWCVAVSWKLSPARRRVRRQVRSGIQIPQLPRRSRIRGSVWAVAMVKNEADIIQSTVEHLLKQGVDGILIADNGSTDGTSTILEELRRRHGVYVAFDLEPAYHQAEKMDLLAAAAGRAGADWIVPFDADERWFGVSTTVVEQLRRHPTPIAVAEIHNVFPGPLGGAQGEWRVDTEKARLQKVAFRWQRMAQLHFGNHAVQRAGRPVSALRILHFPWRSEEQFLRKIRTGAAAIDLAYGVDTRGSGEHWRELDTRDDERLSSTYERMLDGKTDLSLEWRPVGVLVPIEVRGLHEWADVEVLISGVDMNSSTEPRVKITTRSINDFLYSKAVSFLDLPYPKERIMGESALGYLLRIVRDESADYVINVDEDAYMFRPDAVRAQLEHMIENGIVVCGVPDGGVIPHRDFNPRSINPFFTIMNTKAIRQLLGDGEPFVNQVLDGSHFLDGHPRELLLGAHKLGEHEPFDKFFVWLTENAKTEYLEAQVGEDGVSTVPMNFKGEPFLTHTWYTREYLRDSTHTRRIHRAINSAADLNAAGLKVSCVERARAERKLLEYRVARKIYIALKVRYKLV